jgi:antitoxin component YwqK of YwqJK toxin-antitoxin module
MTIHYSKVELRNGKYYYTKDISIADKLVTAKVLFFSNSGELECDFNFKDGVFNGIQKLYKDKYYQLSSEESYTNGILNGISKFYKNGKLENEIMYKDGKSI